jgi:hypothetical protein
MALEKLISRRMAIALLGSAAAAAPARWPDAWRRKIADFLETHRRPEGAYGWASDVTAQVTPTYGVVGSYRILGLPVPNAAQVAAFVRDTYPVPPARRKERPLWRLDFEQMQTLLFLGEPVDSFRNLAETWTGPAAFTTRYELGGNPVFQHQAMAVRVRALLKISPADTDGRWRSYFAERRRANGTFNNTPASDGSGGHVMNTLWGLLASEAIGLEPKKSDELVSWVRDCQLPSDGFTYAPGAELGGVDDIAYTVSALHVLAHLGAAPENPRRCAEWIESLLTPEGGFQDRPGGEPNPLATYYALDALQLLKHIPQGRVKPAARAKRHPIPAGANVFSMQVEAPGNGSPSEAVLLAKALGIHIWTAKNSPAGWVAEAQSIADRQGVPVRFAIGDEEYGTYVAVPGLGCYSHLVDLVAPAGRDFGAAMSKKNHRYPWPEFRDNRISALRKGDGRLIWQFNENEELTRMLLDEALERPTYSGIATFHFGNENFLQSQPYLQRWYGRIPFTGLQDAHGKESWWWGNQLAGFTTLFVAEEPTWQAWLEALDRNHVMAVRHDAVTGWKTHLAGGSPELRDFVMKRADSWRWWDGEGRQSRRPAAAITVLRPGSKFEVGTPEKGIALRVRLWCENSGAGIPQQPRAELIELTVDGQRTTPETYEAKDDRYHLLALDDRPGAHTARARIRLLGTDRETTVETKWEGAR